MKAYWGEKRVYPVFIILNLGQNYLLKKKCYILEVFSNSSQWFICPRRKYGVYLGFDIVEDFGNNLNKWNSEGGLASVVSFQLPCHLCFLLSGLTCKNLLIAYLGLALC